MLIMQSNIEQIKWAWLQQDGRIHRNIVRIVKSETIVWNTHMYIGEIISNEPFLKR